MAKQVPSTSVTVGSVTGVIGPIRVI